MRRVTSELLSTARPSRLRVAAFLTTVVGAALIGIGATREWASVGLAQDTRHVNDVATNGTDVWEGKACLLIAVLVLVFMLISRIAASSGSRRVLAVLILVAGVACAAIAGVTAVRAEDRFGGEHGVDAFAHRIAQQTHQAEDVVRAALRETLHGQIRIDTGISLWLTAAGGVVLALGGVLSLAWVRERERSRRDSVPEPAG
jgi:tryptophan-associated transmembrane protein